MRKLRKKLNKLGFLGLLCLCLVSFSLNVYAIGSITVKVEEARADLEINICPVAEVDGKLIGSFASLGLSQEQMIKESLRRSSAQTLYEYVTKNGLPSTVIKTDDQGVARFPGAAEAIYLIWEDSDGLEFSPFLVSVPTIVGESVTFDVTAEPKADDPEVTPTPPPTPTPTPPGPTPPPDLPQTGTDMLPIWLLIGFGAVVLLVGVVLLLPAKRKEQKNA